MAESSIDMNTMFTWIKNAPRGSVQLFNENVKDTMNRLGIGRRPRLAADLSSYPNTMPTYNGATVAQFLANACLDDANTLQKLQATAAKRIKTE